MIVAVAAYWLAAALSALNEVGNQQTAGYELFGGAQWYTIKGAEYDKMHRLVMVNAWNHGGVILIMWGLWFAVIAFVAFVVRWIARGFADGETNKP